MKLKIAAKVDKADEAYFKNEIEPLLAQPHVEFIGEIGDAGNPSSGKRYRAALSYRLARTVRLGP